MSAIQNVASSEYRPRCRAESQTSENWPDAVKPIGCEEAVVLATSGQHLGRLRIGSGLTRETLVEKAGLSVRGISDLERGIRWPRTDTINCIAQALGVDGSTFMSRDSLALIRSRRCAGKGTCSVLSTRGSGSGTEVRNL